MFKQNLKILVKQLRRNKTFSVITVAGFSFALMFVILLSLYIAQELSVDQFHEKRHRIFRLTTGLSSNFAPPVGQRLMDTYPEIEAYTRLYSTRGIISDLKGQKISVSYHLVDSSFFTMFSFRFIEGDMKRVFDDKNGIVLTHSYAKKLFGNSSPLGKEVELNSKNRFTVTGVIHDIPENTHIQKCDAFVNFPILADIWGSSDLLSSYSNSSFALYFLVKPNSNIRAKEEEILKAFNNDYWMYTQGFAKDVKFEPLTEIYFGGLNGPAAKGNSMKMVMILTAIAIVILLLAIINYVNLSVAQSSFRSREVAVKKLHGSTKGRLVVQFITESIIICLIAFNIALLLAKLAEPSFNALLETQINISDKFDFLTTVIFGLGIILVGIISGLAPAFFISRYNAIDIVKGTFRRKSKSIIGKILISVQYCAAITLIICTWIIAQQTQFMRKYDLGFNRENIIYYGNDINNSQREAFRDEMLKVPGVVDVAYAAGSPLDGGNNNSMDFYGKPVSFQVFKVDSAFLKMFDLMIKPTGVAYQKGWFCLNETAIRELELDSLAQSLKLPNGQEIPIHGIVKDFHFRDLRTKVGPAMVMYLGKEEWPWGIYIKISGANVAETLKNITKVHKDFTGGLPFDYSFADETIYKWYQKEEQTAQMIGYLTILAIIISIMGVLAMATFYIQQRVKEIGIRKVTGATELGVVKMLNFDLLKWVLLSFVFACPIAYYAMSSWLANFPYKTPIYWWVFILSGIIALGFALLTISWQSYRAASRNPVEALRYE